MFNFKHWLPQGVVVWGVTSLLALVGGSVLTFLKLHNSEWATPLLYGFAVFFMVIVTGALLTAVSLLPRVRTRISVKNVEFNVRKWLDTLRASVKNASTPDTFFRLEVQLPAGGHVIIGRPRNGGLTESIVVRADIVNEQSVPEDIKNASKESGDRLAELIKLELARAKVGYVGLQIPITQQFAIFRNTPISDHLSEDIFLRAVFDVEAAINDPCPRFFYQS